MLKHHKTMSSMIISVYPEYNLDRFKFTRLASTSWNILLQGS